MSNFQDQLQYAVASKDAERLNSLLDALTPGEINNLVVYYDNGHSSLPLLDAAIDIGDPETTNYPDLPYDVSALAESRSPYGLVDVILAHGANPNQGQSLRNAIDVDAEIDDGTNTMTRLLLHYGANPNTRINFVTNNSDSYFTYALTRLPEFNGQLIGEFLADGADVHSPNALTALLISKPALAVQSGFYNLNEFTRMIDMLVDAGLSRDEIRTAYAAVPTYRMRDRSRIQQYIDRTYLSGR